MKKSKLLLILCLVVVLALGVLVSCKDNGDDACAHEKYGAWQITKAPTTTDTGTAIRVCTNGDNVETVTIANLSDTSVWTAGTSTATHEAAGKVTYTSTYGSVEVAVDRLSDHVYDKEIAEAQFLATAADCTHAATYRKSCVCGAVGTATFTSGNPLGHDAHEVAVVAAVHTATTLTNGTKAHHKCDRCGKLFSDASCETEVTAESLVIVATHDFGGWTLVADATCTQDGSVTRTCATCGNVDVGVIPAHDHVYASGKIVVVTKKDVYQEDDGSVVEDDEEATEFHAPVCDICGVMDKANKESHNYGDWECLVEKDINGHDVREIKTCSVCNYIKFKTDNYGNKTSLGYLELAWTIDEENSVAATYTRDGYTIYTKDNYEVKLVLPKLPAPYDNKTYIPMEIYPKSDVTAGANSLYLLGTTITLDNIGNAEGSMQPFMGDIVVTMVNGATGAITLKVGETTFVGFVEPSTGIMVISDDNYNSVYLLSPYEMVRDDVVASYWNGAIAINYHINCGTYLGHDIGILVYDDNVYFGAMFEDANGALIAADNCYNSDVVVINDVNGDLIVAYVKNSDGDMQIADEYRGTYTATVGGEALGDLVVDGIGGFAISGVTQGTPWSSKGIYIATATENVYDAYVMRNGNKVEYYVATMDVKAKTATLVPQTVTITLDLNGHGTLTGSSIITGYVGCVVDLPTPTAPAGGNVEFAYWMNGSVAVNENTVFTENTNLVANWVVSVVISIVDEKSDVTSIKIGIETPILNVLPSYVIGKTVNSAKNTIFEGWYLAADFSGDVIDDELYPEEGEDITVYAKWVPAGAWTITQGSNYGFVYDADLAVWKSNNKGISSSSATMEIIANGKIVISFEYAASSESDTKWDWMQVRKYESFNGNNSIIGEVGGKVDYADMVWKSFDAVLTDGQTIKFTYTKDSGGDHNEDRGFIRNLIINGRAVTLSGTVDFLDGTYTCESKDDLVLDGYGHFTWGTKEGTYTNIGDSTFDMYVVNSGNNVEYYVLTLDGTTYSVVKPNVEVSYNFGEISHSLAASTVNTNIAFTLPTEGLDVNGYVFRGWYDNAEFTGSAITSIVPTANTVVYAKYDVVVTLTYNYLVNGVENKVVSTYGVNDKIGTIEPIGDVTNGSKVFVGWFTKDGSVDDDWGDEVTNETVLTASITVYAKWVVPHALMGAYLGANLDPNETGIAKETDSSFSSTLTIDALGKVTGWKSGVIEDYNTTTGTFALNVNGTKYYGASNVNTGVLYIDYASNKTTPYHDIQFFGKTVGAVTIKSTVNNAWDSGCTKLVTITYSDNSTKTILIKDRIIYGDVTWVATKADGTAIASVDDFAANVDIVIITMGNTTLTLAKLNNNLVVTDGTEGTYTLAGSELTVILNGAGGIVYNGKTGTVTAVDGQDNTYIAMFSDSSYTLTIDVTAKTYTIVENKVNVSFNFGTIEASLDAISVYKDVSSTLPTAPEVTGYVFRGWYDNAEFTGNAKTSITATADTVIYAKYDKAITVTIVYGNGMENGSVTGKFANDAVTVALPDAKDGLYPIGYYTTSTFDEGSEWTSGSVVADDLTIYLKWMEPHALMGTYKGWEAYQGKWQNTTLKTVTIDALGNVTGGTASGTITGYNAVTGTFTIVDGTNSRIGYYDNASNSMIIGYSSNQSTLADDVYILFGSTDPMPKNYSGTDYAARWKSNGSSAYDNYVVYIVLNEGTANEEVKFIYRDATKIYVDVTVTINNVPATKATLKSATAKDNILEITLNDVTIFKGKHDGTTFVGSDGKQGTYTGTGVLASIELDGYGMVTIGDATVVYALEDNRITFVLNNRTMVVELNSDNTCAQLQDGIAGTYTLPDGAGTITLDGLGGAGEGATYVVNGSNITIYTTARSTTYGLDVANKTLLGKSILAGLTFSGKYYSDFQGSFTNIFLIFDDDVDPNGTLYDSRMGGPEFKFTGKLNGNTLTLTFVKAASGASDAGKTLIGTISGNTITFSKGTFSSNAYSFYSQGSVSCEGFSL